MSPRPCPELRFAPQRGRLRCLPGGPLLGDADNNSAAFTQLLPHEKQQEHITRHTISKMWTHPMSVNWRRSLHALE